ncbi:MAG: 6,7-dimethyl-8-ribityllumazine synthase, partial [Gammaproteobacteria bacterium]
MPPTNFNQSDRDPGECRIGIVASRFNGHIVDRLLDGCLRTLEEHR